MLDVREIRQQFVCRSAEKKLVYHAGDTDLIPPMKEMKDIDFVKSPFSGPTGS